MRFPQHQKTTVVILPWSPLLLPLRIQNQLWNWLDLPQDVVLSIFQKLPTIDILILAPSVCTKWCKISKDRFLYRTIDLTGLGGNKYFEILCNRAIDYSCGHVIDISIEYFATNTLLHRIADKYVPLSSRFCFLSIYMHANKFNEGRIHVVIGVDLCLHKNFKKQFF